MPPHELSTRASVLTFPAPNYVSPELRGTPAFFPGFFAVAAVFVCARLYSRILVTRSFGVDDVLIIFALLFGLGETVSMYRAVAYDGWNRHIWDVPYVWGPRARLISWIIQIFFLVGTGCTKVSILLVYRRIARGAVTPTFLYLTWALIAFNVAYVVAFLVS